MSLGKTIHRLRTEQNLSQDGLADALGVSRQSISKWETDSSVPDLDKLVKLSGVFGVTLDELVLGERPAPAPDPVPPAPPPQAAFPPRKIAGAILLCMGFLVVLSCTLLGSLLAGLIFASPLLLCRPCASCSAPIRGSGAHGPSASPWMSTCAMPPESTGG